MQVVEKIKSYFRKPVSVEQVHREFMTASEKLLSEANEIINNNLTEKADRLSKIGFTNANEIESARKTRQTEKYVSTIQKYAISHPNNKVITAEQVEQICKKYGLVQAGISRYKGFVPEKNLKEIEAFKINDTVRVTKPKNEGPYETAIAEMRRRMSDAVWVPRGFFSGDPELSSSSSDKFEICAPLKDMEVYARERVEGHRIVQVPDPVVLHKIENNCYLIVTAWGEEASDPIVVNQKFN